MSLEASRKAGETHLREWGGLISGLEVDVGRGEERVW